MTVTGYNDSLSENLFWFRVYQTSQSKNYAAHSYWCRVMGLRETSDILNRNI